MIGIYPTPLQGYGGMINMWGILYPYLLYVQRTREASKGMLRVMNLKEVGVTEPRLQLLAEIKTLRSNLEQNI